MSTLESANRFRPDSGGVDLWRVPLEVGTDRVDESRKLLSADERERADRFKFDEGRRRFTVARAALRRILSGYGPCQPAEWRFTYGPHGKPGLVVEQAGLDLRFNLSHAHELAVVAVTMGRDVGVDVEWRGREVEFESLARRFFGRKERMVFQAAGVADRAATFFQIWTRKEAWLKARGEGIAVPLEQFDVMEQVWKAAPKADGGKPREAVQWEYAEFQFPADYVGAVVVAGALGGLRQREAGELLV